MTNNSGKAIQKYRAYIKATPQAVWDALTKPEWSVRYGTLNFSVGQSPRHACHDGIAGSPDFYNFAQSTR